MKEDVVKRIADKLIVTEILGLDTNGQWYYKYIILRKCMPNAFDADGVVGVLVHPVVMKTTNVFH